MTIHTTLVKRHALFEGEVGFFPSNPMAQDDIDLVAMHSETMHTIRSERRLEALNFLWGLVHKATDNSDCFLDKNDAMEKLKIRVGYSKAVYDPLTRKIEPRGKSLTRISDEQLRLLTQRIMDAICADVLPGIKQADLRREVEQWLEGPKRP